VQRRLAQRHAHLAPGDASAAVDAALIRFERSSIRGFVPLLVERRASAQLSARGFRSLAGERQPAIT
jgi:hypothetical protein